MPKVAPRPGRGLGPLAARRYPAAPVRPTSLLITGASGFIGGRLAALALERGLRVRTLTRSEWMGEPFVPVGDRFFGTLPWRIPEGCADGVDAVVHCAAMTGAGTDERARDVNVLGTVRLARMALASGARRFVFLSTQSAREDAAAAYGRTKLEAERALAELAARDGLELVVIRPGLVTGGSGGLFGRMASMVERLPVVPLLGGGRALVQPVHVDDLCDGLLRAVEMPVEPGASAPLMVGDPAGVTLAELLRRLARARTGRDKAFVSVPIAPIAWAVRAAESMRVPLPVTSANLRGLAAVERMDTADGMRRLGIPVRPLDDALRAPRAVERAAEVPLASRPVGVALVGGGRIGLLHAVTASRQRGMALACVADTSRRARGLLRGMGVRAPMTASLDEALARPGVDGVIVATPAGSHLALTRRALGASPRMRVLVEKPLAVKADDRRAFEDLGADGARVQVGYLAPRYPHAASAIASLRAGDFGRVTSYQGFTLLSFIRERDSRRWEVQPEISGGGVMANAFGHVLSLVREAFGDPASMTVATRRLVSERVEDCATLRLDHGAFSGTCHASWSIEGLARQENRLVVTTDRGRLTITNGVAVFEPSHGEPGPLDVRHQLDADVGFNLMPDYAGGGIAQEHRDLRLAAREGARPPMDLEAGLAVERLLHRAYAVAVEAPRGAAGDQDADATQPPPSRAASAAGREPDRARLVLDVREVEGADLAAFAALPAARAWAGVVAQPVQLNTLLRAGVPAASVTVTLPDFLHQARLLSAGRPGRLLADWGFDGVLAAGVGGARAALRERGATFWAVASALMAEALRHVPEGFEGTLLVHPMLTDLALGLFREDALASLLSACRERRRAKVGVHSALADHVAEVASIIDVASLLASPRALTLTASIATLREANPRLAILAETGALPASCHRDAARDPIRWEHGADRVMVGAWAEPALVPALRASLRRRWGAVFDDPLPSGLE